MDIRFYDFDFNLLAILPQNSKKIGYTSLNYSIDYNDIGSFELEFVSDKIKTIVEKNKDNLFVATDRFQGYLTGYIFNKTYRLYGKHLNGLLHKNVVPVTEKQTSDVETIARSVISSNFDFLTLGDKLGFENKIEFETDRYIRGEVFMTELLKRDNAGYNIRADFSNKKLIFELIKPKEIRLMLSENNLNAYDFETVYDNKPQAFGGWYSEKQQEGDNIWKYITLENKSGIYIENSVLNANNEADAIIELKKKKSTFDITAKTRKIKWGEDYQLGNIVRVQKDDETVKKIVSSINVSKEAEFIETPTLTEV